MIIYPFIRIEQIAWVYNTDEHPVLVLDSSITSGRMDLITQKYQVKCTLVNSATEEIELTNDGQLNIKSMDDNIFVENLIDDTEMVIGINLYAVREGTAEVWAYYTTETGSIVTGMREIVVYNPWFRDNYWRLLGEYDGSAIGTGTYADMLMQSIMEMFDMLWAYGADLDEITDPIFAKKKFIDTIGKSIGFPRTDFSTDGTPSEYAANKLYRELIANLWDLLSLRGTRLSYEMFFGALGYDIELLEFWYNEEGNLVEIDPYEYSGGISTFHLYDTVGRLISEDAVTSDPRSKSAPGNPYNYCSKSPFIKPVFTSKYNITGYSTSQRNVLKRYLEYLRPEHVQYLSEVIGFSISDNNEIINMPFDNGTVSCVNLLMPYAWIEDGINIELPVTESIITSGQGTWMPPNEAYTITGSTVALLPGEVSPVLLCIPVDNSDNDFIPKIISYYFKIGVSSNVIIETALLPDYNTHERDWVTAVPDVDGYVNIYLPENSTWTEILASGLAIRATCGENPGTAMVSLMTVEIENITSAFTKDIRPQRTYMNGSTARLPYNYIATEYDVTGRLMPGDPGRLDYITQERGSWEESGGGFQVDQISNYFEQFLISMPVSISDIIITMEKYDKTVQYNYDDSELVYDIGYMLQEAVAPNNLRATGLTAVNINNFKSELDVLIATGKTQSAAKIIMLQLPEYIGLSSTQFDIIKNL